MRCRQPRRVAPWGGARSLPPAERWQARPRLGPAPRSKPIHAQRRTVFGRQRRGGQPRPSTLPDVLLARRRPGLDRASLETRAIRTSGPGWLGPFRCAIRVRQLGRPMRFGPKPLCGRAARDCALRVMSPRLRVQLWPLSCPTRPVAGDDVPSRCGRPPKPSSTPPHPSIILPRRVARSASDPGTRQPRGSSRVLRMPGVLPLRCARCAGGAIGLIAVAPVP